jgi:hypothetical protein
MSEKVYYRKSRATTPGKHKDRPSKERSFCVGEPGGTERIGGDRRQAPRHKPGKTGRVLSDNLITPPFATDHRAAIRARGHRRRGAAATSWLPHQTAPRHLRSPRTMHVSGLPSAEGRGGRGTNTANHRVLGSPARVASRTGRTGGRRTRPRWSVPRHAAKSAGTGRQATWRKTGM